MPELNALGGGAERQELTPSSELLFQEPGDVNRQLHDSITRWSPMALHFRWLVNSHPKSGTHLLRNILLHFARGAVHRAIVFFDTYNLALQTTSAPAIYIGHVPRVTFTANAESQGLGTVLLIRHPCAIALALARAFYDVNTTRADYVQMREECSFEEIVRKVICGYECAGFRSSPLATSLAEFTLEWLGETAFVVKFEELVVRLEGPDYRLVAYLAPLLEGMFHTVPIDAAERIRAGATPAISHTYSRTRETALVKIRPADVHSLIPAAESRRLREITAALGYGTAVGGKLTAGG